MQYPPYDEYRQPENHKGARESELFGKRRKREIVIGLRQKAERRLTPLAKTSPPETPVADSDLTLNDMVSLPRRIGIRIDVCLNTVFLIRRQRPYPRHVGTDDSDRDQQEKVPHADTDR